MSTASEHAIVRTKLRAARAQRDELREEVLGLVSVAAKLESLRARAEKAERAASVARRLLRPCLKTLTPGAAEHVKAAYVALDWRNR